MEFYSATKKKEILSFAGKSMELENILSEISQAQKAKNHRFSLICRPKTNAAILLDTGHIKERPCI
jgi:hypothetical protein